MRLKITEPKGGFADYNNTLPALNLLADTWTDITNNGIGGFTNLLNLPSGVTSLMNLPNGEFTFNELTIGDTVFIRNDYIITPVSNNSTLKLRYLIGTGGGAYVLEKLVAKLDLGAAFPQRFSLTPDMLYMGDENTKDNPIKLQLNCSVAATVLNSGSFINVIKR